jgi:hypothetical protein
VVLCCVFSARFTCIAVAAVTAKPGVPVGGAGPAWQAGAHRLGARRLSHRPTGLQVSGLANWRWPRGYACTHDHCDVHTWTIPRRHLLCSSNCVNAGAPVLHKIVTAELRSILHLIKTAASALPPGLHVRVRCAKNGGCCSSPPRGLAEAREPLLRLPVDRTCTSVYPLVATDPNAAVAGDVIGSGSVEDPDSDRLSVLRGGIRSLVRSVYPHLRIQALSA